MVGTDDLKGLWNGSFRYSASAEIGATEFKARIGVTGDQVSGLIVEEHVVHAGQAKSEIVGTFDGQTLRFTKRYIDENEAYGRPVEYEGTMAADRQSIAGTWALPDDSGTFTMERPA